MYTNRYVYKVKTNNYLRWEKAIGLSNLLSIVNEGGIQILSKCLGILVLGGICCSDGSESNNSEDFSSRETLRFGVGVVIIVVLVVVFLVGRGEGDDSTCILLHSFKEGTSYIVCSLCPFISLVEVCGGIEGDVLVTLDGFFIDPLTNFGNLFFIITLSFLIFFFILPAIFVVLRDVVLAIL